MSIELREIDEEENRKMNFDDVFSTPDGQLIFNPYNHLNVEIKQENIKNILTAYGLPPIITNMELYRRAFINSSYVKRTAIENGLQNIKIAERPDNCLPLSTKSNERLEFIGDGVLELTTKYYLYRRFSKGNPGFLTEKKIAIVKNEAIGKIAHEMGLQKWLIISKNAEEKKVRNNLKKLGCLFEAFIGALFLDMNKIKIEDEEKWFENVFVTGPGFQMVQKFLENVFEKHINFVELVQTDDNYKNLLQVKIQKIYKTTPHYIEISHDIDNGFEMGVYLCLGQEIHHANLKTAINLCDVKTFEAITDLFEKNGKVLVFLGKGSHKIKRKAEFTGCKEALKMLESESV
jgi:dsRNA-specific ribonuclease